MSYQPRPHYDARSPVMEYEHRPSPWMQREQPSTYQPPVPQLSSMDHIMVPESEDSEVSTTDGETSAFYPVGLPPAPSKQALENQHTITSRLEELEGIENHNIRKHDHLREKRRHMDDRIHRRRAVQDEKIKAILDTRARKDSRIKQRRDREDIAFQRFYEDLDEEQSRLRQRLKRLKRGLPIDDTDTGGRRSSINSMSPNAGYSTIPPPAKRHQPSHPSLVETLPNRPLGVPPYPPQPTDRPYRHYQPPHHPPSPAPYHTRPSQQHPLVHSPPIPDHARPGPPPQDGVYATNGYNTSPPGATLVALPSNLPHIPPRLPSSNYDTRPPPPAPISGFAAVNQPPPRSGFAAVNSRLAGTPPALNATLVKEHSQNSHSNSVDHTPSRASAGEEKGSSSKRTPSTTHPYQMSEAFANRHHHCERTDSLNRGIWTWHGLGGTRERPTGPAEEMYLRCNHGDCRRIDWRTVHGLQCHIVKNHGEPKGTIGSLEKALAAYGVRVREVEEFEKREGLGKGGTTADPKNTKARSRVRQSGEKRDLTGRNTPASARGPTPLNNQHHSHGSDSPTPALSMYALDSVRQYHSHGEQSHNSGSESTPIDLDKHVPSRPSGFAAVNNSWSTVNVTPSRPPQPHDHVMQEPPKAQAVEDTKPTKLSSPRKPPTPFWPGWQGNSEVPMPEPRNQPTSVSVRAPSELPKMDTVPVLSKHMLGSSTPHVQTPMELSDSHVATNKDLSQALLEPSIETEQNTDQVSLVQDGLAAITDGQKADKHPLEHAAQDAQDTQMSGITETELPNMDNVVTAPASVEAAEAKDSRAVQEPKSEVDTTPTSPKATAEHHPEKGAEIVVEEDVKPVVSSPAISSKRLSSRRESRRTSVATAASSKAGTERFKEDDIEAAAGSAKTRPAESNADDGDSITVNVAAAKADQKEKEKEKQRERERERLLEEESMSTPPRRLANGRFTRRPR